tara:strand:- start:7816 stop:7998 length:183 start_codon:yes stop_codon:yes gene_type:complete
MNREHEMNAFMNRSYEQQKKEAVKQLVEFLQTLPEDKVKETLKELHEWKKNIKDDNTRTD